MQSTKVLFCCSGIGIMNRGIESFFHEAFTYLKGIEGIDALLIKGKGDQAFNEKIIACLPRTSHIAALLGKIASRSPYVIEQWTSFLPIVFHVRRFKPHVIFYSDQNLGFLLYWLRRYIGIPFRLLFSNGGPCHPPFRRLDLVHQVTPSYFEEAIRYGEPAWKHVMVPYGINTGHAPTIISAEEKTALRQSLGLPIQGTILLSVGWISREHKRMDYVIEEVAKLSRPRPFLMLIGALDKKSKEIIQMANDILGGDGFCIRSVHYREVQKYYRAADCFALGSLNEGFGRVYLEALIHGLPVIAHRNAVTEFVLGSEGTLIDLSQPDKLARALVSFQGMNNPALIERRWRYVNGRFSWENLASSYKSMFCYARSGQGMEGHVAS